MNFFLTFDYAPAKLRRGLLCLLGICLIAAGCNSGSIKESSSGDKLASNDNGEVCREYAVTGTRFKKRECKSAATWEAFDEAQRKASEDYKRRVTEQSSITAPGSLDPSGGMTINPNTP